MEPRSWNAFVDLLSDSSYESLGEKGRVAYRAFWYDAEVQRGGHERYLAHRAETLDETLLALDELGAGAQRAILEQARAAAAAGAVERKQQLEALDAAYHACEPDVPELLAAFLDRHLEEFGELDLE